MTKDERISDKVEKLKPSPSACSTEANQDSDDSLSGTSEPGTPGTPSEPPVEAEAKSYVGFSGAMLWSFHMTIFMSCIVFTALVLSFRWVLSFFMSGSLATKKLHRPKARLNWEKLVKAEDPVKLAREKLPVPPPFPEPEEEDFTITFGPCANLMIYTGGVACCLRRCPNYAEIAPKIRFYGNSCGAFVASVMAADLDMLEFLPEMLSWTERFHGRLWGLVGAYSASITAIVWKIFSRPECFEAARERLTIGVTTFSPWPGRLAVTGFDSAKELVSSLLGSCYIPIAFEEPQWSEKHGPLWDGGIFDFASQGNVVVSPYHLSFPDVGPATEYPRSFSFFPPHEADAVSLFEDGYMDCLRWLQNGAPSRRQEREEVSSAESSKHGWAQIAPLLREGKNFFAELLQGCDRTDPRYAPSALPEDHKKSL